MKLNILNLSNVETGKKELPLQFNEEFRPDLIKRAVSTIQNNKRQRYGSAPGAGMRASADISKRRHNYRGCYGHGISRVPRKILTRRGTQFNWVGAIVSGTIGGRRAHPPKAEKIWEKKINMKERRKAIRSAIAATVDKNIVEKRGHSVPDNYPFIIENKFEDIDKTKTVESILKKLGLEKELERSSGKTIRAGKGKLRGRKYKSKKGPLFVVSKECRLEKSANNIPGIDIVKVENINAEFLAPGTHPGRLTIFTESAIDKLEKEKLFMLDKPKPVKKDSRKKDTQPKPAEKIKSGSVEKAKDTKTETKAAMEKPEEKPGNQFKGEKEARSPSETKKTVSPEETTRGEKKAEKEMPETEKIAKTEPETDKPMVKENAVKSEVKNG